MDGAAPSTNSPLVQPIYTRGLFNFLFWYSSLYFITLHNLCWLQNENSDFQVSEITISLGAPPLAQQLGGSY